MRLTDRDTADVYLAIDLAWRSVNPRGLDRDDANGELALFAVSITADKYDPGKGPLVTFLTAAFRNRLKDLCRKQNAANGILELPEGGIEDAQTDIDAERRDAVELVANILDQRLPDDRQRRIFRAAELEGIDSGAIAEREGLSRRQVDRIIGDARQKVRPE